ncbi:amino acid ABC transporter permease [Paraburkholderia sabiae]|uniref:Amino acid ABC transporter permease n=1 Tax=Paraburkholderia sabiae TaxID=273251 RepID=A0ABU9QSS0_9BURK|nr:amino acid ABC transporter permease [Paraburkholderia sabiae]WJZ79540.1 amino acid ABC transporter permease [Paraburkholderia sabiae]WJZ79548.1 amino acid ABC transporter permease [Paraburkholderia sabiae]CAD6563392.1 L-cystine transport system permease protein TcyB [Paraburkholderia sabiae]
MSLLAIVLGIFEGFRVTAVVTVLGLLYAIPFAFVFGILQHMTDGWARRLVTAVIEFWRSSPTIVLLYAFYYSLPSFGVDLSAITVGSMVLGLNIGGYGSQSVRAALQSIERGQTEAGLALGLNRINVLCFVELPQAITATVPNFVSLAIQLVKGTALVSLITLTDMTFRAKEIGQLAYNPIGVYTALVVAYCVICYPMAIIGRRLEARIGKYRGTKHEL